MKLSRHDSNISSLIVLVTSVYLLELITYAQSDDNNNNNNNNKDTDQFSTTAIEPQSETTTTTPITTTTTTTITTPLSPIQHPQCTLGDDTFQIGERWNPNLPPFGVQVCVLCECTIRQRKSCYETKVTCRRITNECPVIDSCPDGSRPVTISGQCCKSCQSTASSNLASAPAFGQDGQQQQSMGASQSVAYERANSSTPPQPSIPFKFIYMNERTKDYLSMVKSLPLCPSRDGDSNKQQATPTMSISPTPKTAKASKNDLNGIDTRLAFKSLHDTGPNYISSSHKSRNDQQEASITTVATTTVSSAQERPGQLDDSLRQDHQHPNDVQSAVGGVYSNHNHHHQHHHHHPSDNTNSPRHPPGQTRGSTSRNAINQQEQSNTCLLGNETFQVGDIWNPVLAPFGVQVCVLCNCIFRVRKGCYETRLTCRRINRECPNIDSCPDGLPPVTVAGQCCKSCPQSTQEQQASQVRYNSTQTFATSSQDNPQRNDKVYRDFQTISRTLSACVKRTGIDLHNRHATSTTTSRRYHR